MLRAACCVSAAALLGCSDTKPLPATRASLADSADQVMFGARFNLTDRGVLRAEMQSDTAYFFDENTRVELDDVHSTFFTAAGTRDAVLTSRRGRYNTRLGDMTAYGNVVVVNQAGRRLETPELHFSQARNEFYSDSQFTLDEPGRQLSGVGFRSDPNLDNVRVLRGVGGFAAGGGQSSAGALPGDQERAPPSPGGPPARPRQ